MSLLHVQCNSYIHKAQTVKRNDDLINAALTQSLAFVCVQICSMWWKGEKSFNQIGIEIRGCPKVEWPKCVVRRTGFLFIFTFCHCNMTPQRWHRMRMLCKVINKKIRIYVLFSPPPQQLPWLLLLLLPRNVHSFLRQPFLNLLMLHSSMNVSEWCDYDNEVCQYDFKLVRTDLTLEILRNKFPMKSTGFCFNRFNSIRTALKLTNESRRNGESPLHQHYRHPHFEPVISLRIY